MRSTTRPQPRRAGRRVLAASAAFGLALSLTACTIGQTDDDEASPGSTSAPASTSQEQNPEEPQPGAPDTPDTPEAGVDQLVLNAEDAPDLGLAPVSTEDITGGVGALEDIAAGVRVEPERCADFNQDSFLAQAEPGAMAVQAGQRGDTAYAVSVTTVTESLPERGRLIADCPTMTVTIPLQGTEVTTLAENSLLPLEAPEGVEHFAAISQSNAMDMMGQEVRTGNVLLTGVVRGIGVSVTAANGAGPVSDADRDTAMDTFVRQVEKIRGA
ncbi:hypothetical protein [Dietzia sp. PP-33]|jgi:hypothetical protein|uniref:hypothetical protein n=1 Tax=Dietzia sp. PP-33 TaxID=2957500 RepID=UPI0029A69C6F|nr:hypothetical protein [Dietzia sp. PP-33]MDX2356952.1 hypothetical protein [Dietzia sp. PP-33]